MNILMFDEILNLVYQLLQSMCNETRGVRIHVQAFINRHGQKHRQGRTNDTGILRARQKSTQVNGRGLRLVNNIQRA